MLRVTFGIIKFLKTETVSFEKKLSILHSLTTEEDRKGKQLFKRDITCRRMLRRTIKREKDKMNQYLLFKQKEGGVCKVNHRGTKCMFAIHSFSFRSITVVTFVITIVIYDD